MRCVLIPHKHFPDINLLLHVVKATVIAVGDDGLSLCLELFKVVDHQTVEERVAIMDRRLAVVHHVYTLWVYVHCQYYVMLRQQCGDADAHIIWDEIPLLSFGKSSYILTIWQGFAAVGYNRRST